jgi:hypothetical protein
MLRDLLAGLTVGMIALPLAMAFGIASIPAEVAAEVGISPPAMGLYTAVVAGFLISALGGSRVQIGRVFRFDRIRLQRSCQCHCSLIHTQANATSA